MRLRPPLALAAIAALLSCAPSERCAADEDCGADEVCETGSCIAAATEGKVVVDSFTAAPSRIAAGDEAALSWRTRNASSCALAPGFATVPRVGGVEVTPSSTTTYSLSCTGAGGPATAEVVVEVVESDAGVVDAGAGDGGLGDGGSSDGGLGDGGLGDGGDGDAGQVGGVIAVTGDVIQADFPADGLDSLDTSGLWLVPERSGVTLPLDVPCDAHYPTTYDAQSPYALPTCLIPAGTVVESWLLHASPDAGALTGTVTFGAEIVGLLWRSGTLGATDGIVGAAGALYADPDTRDLGTENNDGVRLHEDRRTVTVSLLAASADELRVLLLSPGAPPPLVRSATLAPYDGIESLEEGARESLDDAVFLLEKEAALSEPLELDVIATGEYTDIAQLVSDVVPSGTSLTSALVHYDPPPVVDAGPTTRLLVSATLPGRLRGVALTNPKLSTTDALFGHSTTTYDSGSGRRLELPPGALWLSPDERSFLIELTVGTGAPGMDDVRVIYEP